jgi:hypothetical protein
VTLDIEKSLKIICDSIVYSLSKQQIREDQLEIEYYENGVSGSETTRIDTRSELSYFYLLTHILLPAQFHSFPQCRLH